MTQEDAVKNIYITSTNRREVTSSAIFSAIFSKPRKIYKMENKHSRRITKILSTFLSIILIKFPSNLIILDKWLFLIFKSIRNIWESSQPGTFKLNYNLKLF